MTGGNSRKSFYPTLEGIRGIAATAVYVRHASPMMLARFYHSYLAVDLFFVLSGFVLASAYDKVLENRTLSPFAFMKLRVVRLYPLFFLASLIALAASILAANFWGNHLIDYASWLPGMPVPSITAAFLFSLLMLPSIFSLRLFPLNDPAWTLFYELVANAFYALIRPLISYRSLICGLVFLGCGVVGCAYMHKGMDIGFFWKDMEAGFIRTTFSFGVGVLLFELRKKYFASFSLRKNALVAAVLLAVTVGLLAMPSYPAFDMGYDLLAIFIFFPLLVFMASLWGAENKYMNIFNILGKSSYGLYILHVPFSALVAIFYLKIFDTKINLLSGAILLYPCLVACAYLLDRFYDQPLRKLLRRAIMPRLSDNRRLTSNN